MGEAGGDESCDRPPSVGPAVAHALALWRASAELLERLGPQMREEYERAIAIGLAHLRRFDSLEALVVHYAADPGPGDPRAGSVEAWLEEAYRGAGGSGLTRSRVEDVAFWRRARELMAAPNHEREG